MSVRRPLAALTATLLTAVGVAATAGSAAAAPGGTPGPALATYIVTVTPGTPADTAIERSRRLGGEIRHVYTAALNGFAVTLPEDAAAQLHRLPGVEAVQADQELLATETTQSRATWGLDRIDQTGARLDRTYGYTNTGQGVTAYVIDTGIRSTHSDLRGRVVSGYNAVPGGSSTTEDCNGHGTHVAGTIGGTTYGVAKRVTLVPVRVLDCQGRGTTSSVIAGIEYVVDHHVAGRPAVANMSLGGGTDGLLDDAVDRAIDDGITFTVAAGNDGQDAANHSPARVADALTVGATDSRDARAPFSNFGAGVDVFAPGVSITSAWSTSNTTTRTISGTSMAAPHVAGVAALFLQSHVDAGPQAVTAAILGAATPGVVTNSGTGLNGALLYTDW